MNRMEARTLSPASSKAPKHLVILLHGYGSNGDDLIDLAPSFAEVLPEAQFVSPNAPFACEMNPMMGYQWFSLTDYTPELMLKGAEEASPLLNNFIDEQMEQYNTPIERTFLVGFSQGTMMALHVGLRRAKSPAAIVGYSGKLAGPEHLAKDIAVKPPVLLVHGDMDDEIPVAALSEAETALRDAGVEVKSHISKGVGHGIDMDVLRLGGEHLKAHLK